MQHKELQSNTVCNFQFTLFFYTQPLESFELQEDFWRSGCSAWVKCILVLNKLNKTQEKLVESPTSSLSPTDFFLCTRSAIFTSFLQIYPTILAYFNLSKG